MKKQLTKRSKNNYALDAIGVLKDIVKLFPENTLSAHIAIALSEFPNFDGISDKELYFIFEKYKCEKELDHIIPHNEDIKSIIEDSITFESLSNGIEEDEEDYE